MGFFFTPKAITKWKFDKVVVPKLVVKNFTHYEINIVREIFHGDLMSPNSGRVGISPKELNESIDWMHHHEYIHHLPKNRVEELAEIMKSCF